VEVVFKFQLEIRNIKPASKRWVSFLKPGFIGFELIERKIKKRI